MVCLSEMLDLTTKTAGLNASERQSLFTGKSTAVKVIGFLKCSTKQDKVYKKNFFPVNIVTTIGRNTNHFIYVVHIRLFWFD